MTSGSMTRTTPGHPRVARVLTVLAVVFAIGGTMSVEVDGQDPATARAIPAAVDTPPGYDRAVERGWRSLDGSPGHGYWQNGVSYEMSARLDPETAKLEGTARILYAHDAPANLPVVWLNLHQNLHKEGSPRYESQEITGGITIRSLSADGEELEERELEEGPGWEVDGSLMQVRPTIRLEPGDTLQLDIEWEVTLPQRGAGRMGHSDHEVYLVAYWFPKMTVFDNVRGWAARQYMGNAEFYDEFGDYQVDLTVPAGWTVMATGELTNPQDVFSPITLERLAEASGSDEGVMIADRASRDAGTVTTAGQDGWLTYRFQARNVRDFTWTASNVQSWNATSALVVDPEPAPVEASDDDDDDEDEQDRPSAGTPAVVFPAGERRVTIHSFWREDRAPLWSEQWLYAKQSIEHHSEYTGFNYPWSHMTSVEGADIIEGGMEFPMMTVIGAYDDGAQNTDLFNVTSHEIGHMWIPMIVGTDESRHAWMDEGSTTFLEDESKMALWPGVDHHRVEARTYLQAANAEVEGSLMTSGDYYEPGPAYGVASYPKPATLMVALRSVMGEDDWTTAYQTFISEWAFKHPTPWDFFNTFERFAEDDLDWFWTSFYYETWKLDHAVRSVAPKTGGGAVVTIADRGNAIFPAAVRIRTSGGLDFVHDIPVDHWLAGNTTYEIDVAPNAGTVTRVEIDPSGYAPDVDRSNNFWPRGG